LKINKVRYRNFFSAKDVTVNFEDYEGITVIEGENGSGKSILFEAVVWAITGRSIRKSTEESMVNNQAKKNCCVEIWVNDEVYIKRSRKPTSLEFHVDGEVRTQEDARHTQGEIEKTLNTSYKVLLASTVFGQHSDIDFLGASADDKRAIIRTFLNLEEVFKIRDRIKEHKSKHQTAKKSAAALLEENVANQKSLKAKIEELSQDIEETPDITLEEILELEATEARLKDEIEQCEQGEMNANAEIMRYKKSINTGTYTKTGNCDKCGSEIEDKVTKADISAWKGAKVEVELERDQYTRDREDLEAELSKLEIPISSRDYSKLEQARLDKAMLDANIKRLQKLKDRESEVRQDQLKSISSYEVMRFWETAFSEKGLLQYVIRNVLNYFNAQCNTYLYHIANGKYFIEFDEQLSETIWTQKRTLIFHSLSGGQKRMINLSVMLALQYL